MIGFGKIEKYVRDKMGTPRPPSNFETHRSSVGNEKPTPRGTSVTNAKDSISKIVSLQTRPEFYEKQNRCNS